MKCYEVSWLGVREGIGVHRDSSGNPCAIVGTPVGGTAWPEQYVKVVNLTEPFRDKLLSSGCDGAFSHEVTRIQRCHAECTNELWLSQEVEASTDVLVHVNVNSIYAEPHITVQGGEILALSFMPSNGTFYNCKAAFVRLQRGGKIEAASLQQTKRMVMFRQQITLTPNGFDVLLSADGKLTKVPAARAKK